MTKMRTIPERRVAIVPSRLCELLEDLAMRETWCRRALETALKINQLTNHGKEEDPARRKKEDQQLLDLRRQIKQFDAQILEIRLALKDSM